MDRFVITNMRVFRVHGIFSQHTATMPMARILDISVHKPFLGRLLSYGHFVFESAAQDQGLRDIRYVARPDQRDLTIQRVIQRSGLRSSMHPLTPSEQAHHDRHDPRSGGQVIAYLPVESGVEDDGTGEDVPGPELTDKEWLLAKWSEQDARDYRTASTEGTPSGYRPPDYQQPDYEQGYPQPGYGGPDYERPDYGQPEYARSNYRPPDYRPPDRGEPDRGAPDRGTGDRTPPDRTSNPWIKDRPNEQWKMPDSTKRENDGS